MEQEFDKEIDRLLRGHGLDARRAEDSPHRPEQASPVGGAHLDADELSAYAENALPPAARSSYAVHLADCDSCRRVATSLALAAGVPGEIERRAADEAPTAATPRASWRACLAGLFSPRAVRYAAPILAVCLAGVIAFVALRERRDLSSLTLRKAEPAPPTSVSLNSNSTDQTSPTTGTAPAEIDASRARDAATAERGGGSGAAAREGNSGTAAPEQGVAASAPATAQAPLAAPSFADSSSGFAGKVATPVETDEAKKARAMEISAATRDAKPRPEQTTVERAEQNEAVAPAPYAGAVNTMNSARAVSRDEASSRAGGFDQQAQLNRQQQARRGGETRSAEVVRESRESRQGGNEVARRQAARLEAVSPARSRAARAPAAAPPPAGPSEKPDGETRKIENRKFRRQGGAWVDTAYRAGQSLETIDRGSERFRALVANEPALERIARAFGGEVVVVWKNRAYRFK